MTYEAYYPVVSQFDESPEDWCISYFGPPALPYQQCITYFVQAVAIELYSHYKTPGQIFRYCFLDTNGQYGLIQPWNYEACLKIHSLEDVARGYGPR